MDMIKRRDYLKVVENPGKSLDYVITLSGDLAGCPQAQTITLRYIPDRHILEDGSFAKYLDAIRTCKWLNSEDVAVTALTDLNNELVARWLQLSLNAPHHQASALNTHEVVLEDRQPGWDNANLLNRLGQI